MTATNDDDAKPLPESQTSYVARSCNRVFGSADPSRLRGFLDGLLHGAEDFRQLHLQARSELADTDECWIAYAALDTTHVGTVKARTVSKLLLR